MKRSYIVIGEGGIGKLVVDTLRGQGTPVLIARKSEKGILSTDLEKLTMHGDLTNPEALNGLCHFMTEYAIMQKQDGAPVYGLLNTIGIPARVREGASDQEHAQVMQASQRINYEVPIVLARHFATLVREGSVVFFSSQHTVMKTPDKETYWRPKERLEQEARYIADLYPNLKVNTLLPGNLGLGMSAGARLQYEQDGTLVDQAVIVNETLQWLTDPPASGQRILITAENNQTTVKKV